MAQRGGRSSGGSSPFGKIMWGLGIGALVLIAVIIVGALVSGAKEDKRPEASTSSAPQVQYELHVAKDNATHFVATVLVAPSVSGQECLAVVKGVIRANAKGRMGSVQVFDDAAAEKLAMCWCDRETTNEEDTFCVTHLKAQGLIQGAKMKTWVCGGMTGGDTNISWDDL